MTATMYVTIDLINTGKKDGKYNAKMHLLLRIRISQTKRERQPFSFCHFFGQLLETEQKRGPDEAHSLLSPLAKWHIKTNHWFNSYYQTDIQTDTTERFTTARMHGDGNTWVDPLQLKLTYISISFIVPRVF